MSASTTRSWPRSSNASIVLDRTVTRAPVGSRLVDRRVIDREAPTTTGAAAGPAARVQRARV
jgi:hypothetical protein